MIQVTDLRVGNLVFYPTVNLNNGEPFDEVIEVKANDIKNLEISRNYLKPIPLTEEWLDNFGFEKVKYGYKFPKIDGNEYRMKIGRWVTKKFLQEDVLLEHPFIRYDGICDIHYVHQLQNLYHALTGQELTIKTETNGN